MFTPRSVARTLLDRASVQGMALTNLKLQKLMYLAHGLMLAKHQRALVNEPFQAWKYGPVLESLYHDLKVYGQGPIRPTDDFVNMWPALPATAHHEIAAIDGVLHQFGLKSGGQLIQLTHDPKGPWHAAYEADVSQIAISDKKIASYFGAKLNPAG